MWILWVLCFSPPPDGELLGGKGCIWSTVSSDQHGLVLPKCIWKWWLEGGGGVTAKPLTDLSVCKSFLSKIYRNFFLSSLLALILKSLIGKTHDTIKILQAWFMVTDFPSPTLHLEPLCYLTPRQLLILFLIPSWNTISLASLIPQSSSSLGMPSLSSL